MQKSYFNIIAKTSFCFFMILTSCNSVFEKNIEDEEVAMIIPLNNSTSNTNNVHFKWNEVEGASFYNLQIVSPSFNAISQFVLDSNITNEEYYFVLSPGTYQFQIRAENSGHKTAYTSPITFTVDSTSNLTGQIVPLTSPNNDIYSNQKLFTFKWQNIQAAESYDFQIRLGIDFEASSTVLELKENLSTNTYTPSANDFQFENEGVYSWGVRAVNTTSQTSSKYQSRTINIDTTSPSAQALVAPITEAIFVDTVIFYWTNAADPGIVKSPVTSQLEIATDVNFTSPLETYTTELDTVFHVFNTGTYFWRMFATDAAGNKSTNTETREITIQ